MSQLIEFLQLEEQALLKQREGIDTLLAHTQSMLEYARKNAEEQSSPRVAELRVKKDKTLKYVNPPKYSEQLLDFFKQHPNRAFTQADIADHFYPLWHKFATGKTSCTSRIGALLYGLRKHPDIKVTKTSDKRFAMTYVC